MDPHHLPSADFKQELAKLLVEKATWLEKEAAFAKERAKLNAEIRNYQSILKNDDEEGEQVSRRGSSEIFHNSTPKY